MTKELSAEQHQALQAYAKQHGRTWRSRLSNEWMKASASPILHGLRNTHGPSWLAKVKVA